MLTLAFFTFGLIRSSSKTFAVNAAWVDMILFMPSAWATQRAAILCDCSACSSVSFSTVSDGGGKGTPAR